MKVYMKKVHPAAIMPTYGSAGAAGADLYALPAEDHPVVIASGETVMIHTGVAAAIPEGYVGLVYARSGLACKRGVAPANKVGVIDSDYRGEIMVALHNHGEMPQAIEPGDRIAQLVIAPVVQASFEWTEDLDDTTRGAGGFGSTGA
jgi:dUTP pyrophosphatase